MTGEEFHDALTLLPEDLIAEADAIRCRKPRRIRYQPYVSLAACFAVFLAAGFVFRFYQENSSRSQAEQSPVLMSPAPEAEVGSGDMEFWDSAAPDAQPVCIRLPRLSGTTDASVSQTVTVLDCREELDAKLEEIGSLYQTDTLTQACAGYDDAWFAGQSVLFVFAQEISGSCTFSDIQWTEDGCTVSLAVHPDTGEQAGDACILIPVQKGSIDPDKVTVIYISDTNP